jgi:hypothetical protein
VQLPGPAKQGAHHGGTQGLAALTLARPIGGIAVRVRNLEKIGFFRGRHYGKVE